MYRTLLSLSVVASLASSMTAAKVLPRGNSCGVVGYDSHTDAYFYDDSGKYAGYTKCADHCTNDSKCQSFGYDASSICMHFSVPVSGNVDKDKSSPDTYYDRGCITTSTAITTTTASTSAQASKTTTTASTSTSKSTTVSATTSKTASSTTLRTSTTSSVTTSSTTTKSTTSTTTTKAATTTTTSNAVSTTSTTKTASTSSSTSTTVAVPSGCNVPAAYTISSFSWFNSTHNLDCATGPDVGDGTGCIKSDTSGNTVWCDPKTDSSCTSCGIAVCSTSLPPQPLGYGPPDDVKFTFADGSTCEQLNPAVVHRYEVGNGYVNCGSSYDFMNFYGSSNGVTNVGQVEINGYPVQCADGQTIYPYYNTNFNIGCTRDTSGNATCTTSGSFSIPLIRYTKS